LTPFLKKEQFQFDGYFLNHSDIKRVVVKESEKTTKEYTQYENDNMWSGIIMYVSPSDILSYDKHVSDITKKLFEKCRTKIMHSLGKTEGVKIKDQTNHKSGSNTPKLDHSKVFIVHGHDELAQSETAGFLGKLKLKPIILHEQASCGNTIIESLLSRQ